MAGEWRELPFTQAVAVNPRVQLTRGATYPFVDMNAVNAGSRFAYASQQRRFDGGGSRFAVGDTLMARITPCLENGKIARFAGQPGEIAYGSTEFIVIRGRDGVSDTDYTYYLAKWEGVRGYAISQMTGTSGRQRVPSEALDHLRVPLPPLPQQRAIAHILGSLDDKIELNRRMCETLEGIARAIFKSWFVDFDPVRAKGGASKKHLPAEVVDLFPSKLVESPAGPAPDGWEVAPLGEHLEVVRGLSYRGADLAEEGMPLHNLNSVLEGGGYKYEGLKRYVGKYQERHLVEPGDVIVANTEQGHKYLLIGYPALVPRLYGAAGIFSADLFRVRPQARSPLTRRFVYLLLLTPRLHDEVVSYTQGTTVNHLSMDGLRQPLVVVPPAELVGAFERLTAPLLDLSERLVAQSRALAELRDALLPKLISGELRVADAERFMERVGT